MLKNAYWYGAVIGVILCCCGCTRTLDFKLVDRETHQPIEGASVSIFRNGADILSPGDIWDNATNANGETHVELRSRKAVYQITFQKKGYEKAAVHPNIEGKNVVRIRSPFVLPVVKDNAKDVSGANVVEIEMVPKK
jgi:hypothetical protein